MELIYQGSVIEAETRTSNLAEEQVFAVKQYGTGWYKVRVTAENRKNKKCMGKSNERK